MLKTSTKGLDFEERITLDPRRLVGKPTIRGSRISVELVLTALAGGITVDELLDDYPELELEDFPAVLMYAADVISNHKLITEFHQRQWERQIADDLDAGEFDEYIVELQAEYAEGLARSL